MQMFAAVWRLQTTLKQTQSSGTFTSIAISISIISFPSTNILTYYYDIIIIFVGYDLY